VGVAGPGLAVVEGVDVTDGEEGIRSPGQGAQAEGNGRRWGTGHPRGRPRVR